MKTLRLILAAVCITLTASCGNHRKSADWRTSDDVHIAIDETFEDIMSEEIETYSLLYPDVTCRPIFCNEDSALKMLAMDSIRCCVVTRPLNEGELQRIKSHNLSDRQAIVATDAFALIVNKNNPDTLITVDDIKGIVSGKITRWEQLRYSGKKGELKFVFDHSGSSTVRFMRDSLLAGRQVSGNLYAQGSNKAVIEAVKENPDIIGVVGANWLKGRKDTVITDFDNLNVKVLKVARKAEDNVIGWKPYQYRIYTGDYPLVRSVWIISTDYRRKSNTTKFFFFLKGQKGQTIICNGSQLLPYVAVQEKAVNMK